MTSIRSFVDDSADSFTGIVQCTYPNKLIALRDEAAQWRRTFAKRGYPVTSHLWAAIEAACEERLSYLLHKE